MYTSTLIKITLTIFLSTQAILALGIGNVEKIDDYELFENYTDLFPQEKALPRCGQALTTENGGIFYKAFEPVQSNERCVWVIGVPGAVGYKVNIQHLGFPANQENTAQRLIITGVKLGPVMTTYIPHYPGALNVTDANILVVTLYSTLLNDTLSSGFALQYEAIRTGSLRKTANASSHHVLEPNTFGFKHPSTRSEYANYELSSFVFPPRDNLHSRGNSNVYYQRGGLEGGCYDALYIYTLNVEDISASTWESKGRICNADASVEITSNEVILILFQSDESQVSTGFSLSYATCEFV